MNWVVSQSLKKNSVNHSIKKKVLNKPNNLNVNVENQVKIKVYAQWVCKYVSTDSLNSAVHLARLRLLTNIAVTNGFQHLLSSSITGLLHLLLTGNTNTSLDFKLLLILFENPATTEGPSTPACSFSETLNSGRVYLWVAFTVLETFFLLWDFLV